ncbi:MAG TPA: hypothetical protein VLL97_06635, partial [Acidobacteriota bacterium]|nr:hypothetical protein [Acidobacteriota bacterium]
MDSTEKSSCLSLPPEKKAGQDGSCFICFVVGITNDGDVWFVFTDHKLDGSDKIKIEMSFPTFGNIVEAAGGHTL